MTCRTDYDHSKRRRIAALFFSIASAGAFCLACSDARAATILSDNFSNDTASGVAITAPSGTNITGNANYSNSGSNTAALISTGSAGTGNPAPAAQDNTGQGNLAISLASNGGYIKPSVFTVSVDLSPGTLGTFNGATDGGSAHERGIGIGFYSTISGTQFTNNKYTGFVLDNLGNLSLVQDTSTTGFSPPTPFATVAFGGTFVASNFYTLTFTVNTSTGNLSNVSLSGSTATTYDSAFDSTTYFQDPATAYLGLYTSGTHNTDVGYIDNVLVQTPEPASIALLGFGSVLLLGRIRRSA